MPRGRLEFTGVTVSESTGAITLRAVFSEPGRDAAAWHVRGGS